MLVEVAKTFIMSYKIAFHNVVENDFAFGVQHQITVVNQYLKT